MNPENENPFVSSSTIMSVADRGSAGQDRSHPHSSFSYDPRDQPHGRGHTQLHAHPLQSPSPNTMTRQRQNHSHLFVSPDAPMDASSSTTTTTTTMSTTRNPTTNSERVQSARKDFQRHGGGVTQSLEEIRRADEGRSGTLTARLVGTEERRDIVGKRYTSYVLHVKLPNSVQTQVEHRYSDFAKLHDILDHYGIRLVDGSGNGNGNGNIVVFPKKHIAGRIGNWTPSLKWAPTQHDDLVRYRKVQLDVWLTHVCQQYNVGNLPHVVSHAVLEFCSIGGDRPPCDYDNRAMMLTINNGNEGGVLSEMGDNGTNGTRSSSSITGGGWRDSNPLSWTLGSNIRQACCIVDEMCCTATLSSSSSMQSPLPSKGIALNGSDQSIPLDLLHHAKGLMFLTVIKGGFVVSGRIGTGLLIARSGSTSGGGNSDNSSSWSAPCAIGTVGLGWGLLAGVESSHYLVVLTTDEAVQSMVQGNAALGAELAMAAGPVGRGTSASVSNKGWAVHPAYSYAHSKGLFVGVSLEGAAISPRHDVNAKFYGRTDLQPDQILFNMPPPKAAKPLYEKLRRALSAEIPDDGFRPSKLFHKENSGCQTTNINGTVN